MHAPRHSYLHPPCIGFIIFPLIWIATYAYLRHKFRYTHWIHVLTHIWTLYYYVSLSLRENILRVNGSNIKPWWIYHHYVSAVMSITVLTCTCSCAAMAPTFWPAACVQPRMGAAPPTHLDRMPHASTPPTPAQGPPTASPGMS